MLTSLDERDCGILLNRDTGALDHVRPFGDLDFDKRLDVGKRHIHRYAGIRDNPVLHRRLGKRFLYLRVKFLDDRLRRIFRRPKAEPHFINVVGNAGFRDGRNIGQ